MGDLLGVKVPTTTDQAKTTGKGTWTLLKKYGKIGAVLAVTGLGLNMASQRTPDSIGGVTIKPLKEGLSDGVQGVLSGDPVVMGIKGISGAQKIINGYIGPALVEKGGQTGKGLVENWSVSI